MAIITTKCSATIEDLMKIPKDGFKYELVDGKILMRPARTRHSEIALTIGSLIREFLRKHPIGRVG